MKLKEGRTDASINGWQWKQWRREETKRGRKDGRQRAREGREGGTKKEDGGVKRKDNGNEEIGEYSCSSHLQLDG